MTIVKKNGFYYEILYLVWIDMLEKYFLENKWKKGVTLFCLPYTILPYKLFYVLI